MSGAKIEGMKESGKTIKCMELVSLNGQTEENTKVNTSVIKNMELEFSIGPMDAGIMGLGKMENSTVEESTT